MKVIMVGKRQIKKEETRKHLIVKARELFSEHGVKEIGMRQLAKESGLGLGTYYNYFKNKDEIIFAISDSIFSDMFKLEAAIMKSDKENSLSNLIIKYLEELSKNKEVITQLVQVISHMDQYTDSESEGRKFTEKHITNYTQVVSKYFTVKELSVDLQSFSRLCWHQLMIFIYMWFMDQSEGYSQTKSFIQTTNRVLVNGALKRE